MRLLIYSCVFWGNVYCTFSLALFFLHDEGCVCAYSCEVFLVLNIAALLTHFQHFMCLRQLGCYRELNLEGGCCSSGSSSGSSSRYNNNGDSDESLRDTFCGAGRFW